MSKEMKESNIPWVGNIPYAWHTKKIKYLADSTQENSFMDGDWIESPYITDVGIRYYTTGNIGDGVFKEQGNGYISQDTFEKLNCKYAYPDDFVIARLNTPFGRACILPNESDKYVLAVDIVILRTKENKKYLNYLMQCEGYHAAVGELARGTTMLRISRSNLGNIHLPIPPRTEQDTIVKYLDKYCNAIDSSISRHQQIIEKLEEYRKAEITRAVTKCEEFRKMKFLFDIYAGATPKSTIEEYWDGDIIWITPADFKTEDHFVSSGRRNLTDAGYHAANTTIVPEGSIIVSKRAPIGTVAITNVPLCTNQGCLSCVPKEYVSSKFYYYVMIAMNESMQVLGAGTTFQEISANSFANMKVPYCDYDEQLKIAEALDKVNVKIGNAIEQHNQLISKLKEYKKSLIYNAVTGKIDCREGA
jgi:type I restriction enzyme S subunit